MTEYQSAKTKLSDSQLDKCKSVAKCMAGITLKLSSDMIGTDENNFHIICYWLIGKS